MLMNPQPPPVTKLEVLGPHGSPGSAHVPTTRGKLTLRLEFVPVWLLPEKQTSGCAVRLQAACFPQTNGSISG